MHVLFKRRRARWGRIERAVRGFYVPEYLRKEAGDRLLGETVDNIAEWHNFRGRDWIADQTPNMHWPTMARLFPLEIFVIYGLFNDKFYERYFYNETKPEISDAEA